MLVFDERLSFDLEEGAFLERDSAGGALLRLRAEGPAFSVSHFRLPSGGPVFPALWADQREMDVCLRFPGRPPAHLVIRREAGSAVFLLYLLLEETGAVRIGLRCARADADQACADLMEVWESAVADGFLAVTGGADVRGLRDALSRAR